MGDHGKGGSYTQGKGGKECGGDDKTIDKIVKGIPDQNQGPSGTVHLAFRRMTMAPQDKLF